MKLRKFNQNDQEKSNSENDRDVPPEVGPLSNEEIPGLPEEYGNGNDEDQVTKDEYSEY